MSKPERLICTLALVPPELTRNRGLVHTNLFGNLRLIQARLFQPVNLVSFSDGELLICLHLCSFYLVV